jgi:putative endonuclease
VPPTTKQKGGAAERLASEFLRRHGYRILETNYRFAGGEIDIVAEEQEVLCFVEVRSRRDANLGHPVETIDPAKQRRLGRAALHYISRRDQEDRELRFDVVGIVYEPKLSVTLIRDAFEPEVGW